MKKLFCLIELRVIEVHIFYAFSSFKSDKIFKYNTIISYFVGANSSHNCPNYIG